MRTTGRTLFQLEAKRAKEEGGDGNLSDLLRGNIRFFSPSAKGTLFLFRGDGEGVKYDGGRGKHVERVKMMD